VVLTGLLKFEVIDANVVDVAVDVDDLGIEWVMERILQNVGRSERHGHAIFG